jgi:OOP family OmpA-OmpF porin
MAEKMRELWKSAVVQAWRDGAAPNAKSPASDKTPGRAAPKDAIGGPGPGGPKGGATPKSTIADIFFDYDSAELTPSAKEALDKYANTYKMARISNKVVVEAFASSEGDKDYNQKLSDKRAKAVADYLIAKGVTNVKPEGKGETDRFSSSDLAQNRRATLSPRSPLTVTRKDEPTEGKEPKGNKPGGEEPDSKGKAPIGLPPITDKTKDRISNEPLGVPLDQVEQELVGFLKKLAENQQSKDGWVTSTDIVHQADIALHLGLGKGSAPTKRGGHGGRFEPKNLARQIVQDLPQRVPMENVQKFRKLEPIDKRVDPTITDHLHDKWKELQGKVHKLIDGIPVLPKKAKDFLKEKFDEAVKKGAEAILDAAMKEVGVPEDAKKKLKEYYQERIKEIMEGKKKDEKKKK